MANKLDALQWANLSSLLAQLAAGFTAANPGQERMRAGLEDSAKGSIAAEAAKKEAKKQEKASKGGLGGALGSTLGTAAGVVLAPATGGLSLAIPAAAGAAGGAIGTAAGGGKITTPGVLGDALNGVMAAPSSTASSTLPKGIDIGAGYTPGIPGRRATGLANAKMADVGLTDMPGGNFSRGLVTPAKPNPQALAPGFTANQAKSAMAPAPTTPLAPNRFMANHPRINRFTNGLRQATLARTNPVGLLTEQATAQGPGQPIVYRAGGKTYVQY